MPDPMKVLVPPGWTPETVVAVAGPVPIGDILNVHELHGRDLGLFEVTHLYRYQCDGQPSSEPGQEQSAIDYITLPGRFA